MPASFDYQPENFMSASASNPFAFECRWVPVPPLAARPQSWISTSRNVRGQLFTTKAIPSKANSKVHIPHDKALYRQRHKVENMFGKLKDWRRIHTRYDRCAHTFMSAICIAATVIFWLNQ
jgi:transposase